MRWINLAKQLPYFPLHKALLRVVGTNSNTLTILAHWYKLTDKTLTLTDREVGAVWELDELEWLDESESATWVNSPGLIPPEEIPDGYMLVKAGVTFIPDGKEGEWARKFLAADVDNIRAEQHKQTLFNALDFIEPHWTMFESTLRPREHIQEILSKVPMEKVL